MLAMVFLSGLFGLAAVGRAVAADRVVLPDDVVPDHYHITVTPDVKALTFTGQARIEVTVRRPTVRIVLNSADIVIDRATLLGHARPLSVAYDTVEQTAILTIGARVSPGPHRLSLAYHGQIFRQASGLSALDYATPGGEARALFTQFENSDARRFVPCWDEPGRKATFELTAVAPAGLMAISNMPAAEVTPLSGGITQVRFQTTPKMSSYLLFFGLGDFERPHRLVDGVDVGVVVKRGDTARGEFALDAASHILPYYDDYCGKPFPLPKLDLIAGPGSSQTFGAMENWGAIFYFDKDVLIDSRLSTDADRQKVYVVVAHEMAHQWFGDLVTMDWWDGLWLNEGFASWMENKVTDHFHPEWKRWLQALADKETAMEVDAREGTHPIITPIHDVLEAGSAFDDITYLKGAAVIRMLEAYVSEDAFRDGVRRYMQSHAYGNTVTDDLWAAMDQGSAHPLTGVAHDFTLQAGVPTIKETAATCVDGRTRLGRSEGRYAIDAASSGGAAWRAPVTASTAGGGPAKLVIEGAAAAQTDLPGCGAVTVNAGQTAYFRSRYTKAGFAALEGEFGSLPEDDQLGLFNDTAALAYVGASPMADLLGLMTAAPVGADPFLLKSLVGRLSDLDDSYDELPTQGAYRAWARGLLSQIFVRVDWESRVAEPGDTGSLRSGLIRLLGRLGDAEIIAEAHRRFDRFLVDPASLDAGARQAVLGVIAGRADPGAWDRLHALAKGAGALLEKQQLYDLLAEPEDPALAQAALDLAISGEPPTTLAMEMVGVVASRHPAMAFDFVTAHWDRIAPLIEPNSRPEVIAHLLTASSDLTLIDRMEAFAADHIDASGRLPLRQIEARVRYQAMIRRSRLPEVDAWLKTRTS
jgi:aminopeptidase N